MGYFIIKLLTLLFILLSSCAFTMNNKHDNIQVIEVKEMETIKELENIKFISSSNTDKLDINYLKSFKNIIKNTNLYQISKWALKEMENYKIPDNFIDTLNFEGFYKNNEYTTYMFRSIELPTHTPLVKRFLYIGYNYKNNQLQKIIITIQGYAEE